MKRWPIMPLGEICFAKSGNSKIIKGTLSTKNDGALFPALSATGQDVFSDGFDFDGDGVVISAVGARCGKCFLASGKWRAIANTHVVLPRPDRVNVRFLWYLLNDESFWVKGGTAQPFVKVSDSLKKSIAVPPLAEQGRIVKLLDEADALRKLRAQADCRTADLIPALFNSMFGDPVHDPRGYSVRPLEEVCSRITDGTHQPPPFTEEGIPFLFVRNIISGAIDFDTEKCISEKTFTELTRRVKAERGDVLYSTVGSYGVAVQVETDRKFAFQRHIGHLKPDRQQIDSGFLTAQLNTPWLKSQADQSARGIAQKTVNLAEIRKFKVLVPPMPLQQEFAQRVTGIRELDVAHGASRRRLDDLFQSMLHRAFSGEL